MKKQSQEKGITLVALVVTVIILLILAGVTIGMLTGESGILKNAETAVSLYGREKGMEQIQLVLGEETLERTITGKELTIASLVEAFEAQSWVNGVESLEEESKLTIINEDGYVYDIIINEQNEIEIEYIGKNTEARISKILVTDKNTNSISIEVKTINAEDAKYTYWYRKQGEEEYIKADESDTNTCTFTGLETDIIYEIKVEIQSSKGNAEKQINVLTGKMPQGTITFENIIWVNGQASVQISTTETQYKLQYQINGTEKYKWEEITSGVIIEELNHNDKVYARLWDGTNGTEPASVDIKDEEAPTLEMEVIKIKGKSAQITVTAEDSKSGIKEYKYYVGEELKETSTTNNSVYTYRGLEGLTTYTLKVVVVDNAGNETSKTQEITTLDATIENTLEAGDYIIYVDAKGTERKSIVLYDVDYNTKNKTNYGIQIITADTIEESVKIGSQTWSESVTSYNSAISTLNAKAEEYRNANISGSARCVGTVPNNSNSESGLYSNTELEWMTTHKFNGIIKGGDTNYIADWNQMEALGISASNQNYWLGSRNNVISGESPGTEARFDVRWVTAEGVRSDYTGIFFIYSRRLV